MLTSRRRTRCVNRYRGGGIVPGSSQSSTSFEARVSQVRLWTLLPAAGLPLLVWDQLATRTGVPSGVSRAVFGVLMFVLLFAWWLWAAAPRPTSVQAAMGRSPS